MHNAIKDMVAAKKKLYISKYEYISNASKIPFRLLIINDNIGT